jgi:hypothetical protein
VVSILFTGPLASKDGSRGLSPSGSSAPQVITRDNHSAASRVCGVAMSRRRLLAPLRRGTTGVQSVRLGGAHQRRVSLDPAAVARNLSRGRRLPPPSTMSDPSLRTLRTRRASCCICVQLPAAYASSATMCHVVEKPQAVTTVRTANIEVDCCPYKDVSSCVTVCQGASSVTDNGMGGSRPSRFTSDFIDSRQHKDVCFLFVS